MDWTDDSQDRQIERVNVDNPKKQREALAVLLTGRLRPADAAVDGFLRFCHDQNISLERLWTIREADRPEIIAATLIAPSPGRTGMLFISPTPRHGRSHAATQLVRTVIAEEDPKQMKLVQALLEPNQNEVASVLEAAGFCRLATLAYLQCHADLFTPSDDGPGLELSHQITHWSENRRSLFEETILTSYEETLDCPKLLGLRPIGDIVEGHKATGQFNPQLWSVYLQEGKPVAVMLLSHLPSQRSMELVYLGVIKSARHQGFGRHLVKRALIAAAAHRALSLVLAVDEANTPACRLYRSLGFRTTARKLAMIVSLK